MSRMDEQPRISSNRAGGAAEQVRPARLQFTLARLFVCTALIAVAAWVSTVNLPLRISSAITSDRDIAPAILVCLLLASSIGVLAAGRRGATEGLRAGCALLIIAFGVILPVFVLLRELIVQRHG
jgi:hypothetical protein